jgi:hypothetical protein
MNRRGLETRRSALLTLALLLATLAATAADKKLVLIAGKPSHGPGDHEYNAGCALLKKCLDPVPGLRVVVCGGGWPAEVAALEDADAIALYSDGGAGHPFIAGDHLATLGRLLNKGVGLGLMHFAVEVPKDRAGAEFQQWIGGYYEDQFSCNPMWSPDYQKFADHPITRGVPPFSVRDEWYFNMRFRPELAGIAPILLAKPSDAVRDGPYVWPRGPYAHIQANKGRDEYMMWAVERPDGGRGFGWTGGHYHRNWGNEGYRKVVLNALVWLAKLDVPPGGVPSTVSEDDLKQGLDPKRK